MVKVPFLLGHRVASGFLNRRPLDSHRDEVGLPRQEVKALPGGPVIVKLISVTARSNQIWPGHSRNVDPQAKLSLIACVVLDCRNGRVWAGSMEYSRACQSLSDVCNLLRNGRS